MISNVIPLVTVYHPRKGKEEKEEEEVKTELITDKTDLASSSASKERTAAHKSNTGFSKLLCASLMIFFLLLAISFFIAFFSKYANRTNKQYLLYMKRGYLLKTDF